MIRIDILDLLFWMLTIPVMQKQAVTQPYMVTYTRVLHSILQETSTLHSTNQNKAYNKTNIKFQYDLLTLLTIMEE